jgi:hypothetical protein
LLEAQSETIGIGNPQLLRPIVGELWLAHLDTVGTQVRVSLFDVFAVYVKFDVGMALRKHSIRF